jgi:hypothetical protein
MRIIRAIVAGERDPGILASHRDPRCHVTLETLGAALTGNDREEHLFARTQVLKLYDISPPSSKASSVPTMDSFSITIPARKRLWLPAPPIARQFRTTSARGWPPRSSKPLSGLAHFDNKNRLQLVSE